MSFKTRLKLTASLKISELCLSSESSCASQRCRTIRFRRNGERISCRPSLTVWRIKPLTTISATCSRKKWTRSMSSTSSLSSSRDSRWLESTTPQTKIGKTNNRWTKILARTIRESKDFKNKSRWLLRKTISSSERWWAMKRRSLLVLAHQTRRLATMESGLPQFSTTLQALIRAAVGGPQIRLRTMYQIKTERTTEVEPWADLIMKYKPSIELSRRKSPLDQTHLRAETLF